MTDPRKIIEKIQKRDEFLKFVKEQVPTLQDSPEDISIHLFLLSWIAGEIKDIPYGKAFMEREVLPALNSVMNIFNPLPGANMNYPIPTGKTKAPKRARISQGGIYRKKKGEKGYFTYHVYRENGKKREKYLGAFNELSNEQAEVYKRAPSVSVQIIDSTRNIFELYFLNTKGKKQFLGHTALKKSGKRG